MLLDKHNKGPKCHIPARPMSFHPEEVQKLLPRSLAVPGLPPAPWGTAPATSEALPGVGSLATQDTCHCASPYGCLQTLQLSPWGAVETLHQQVRRTLVPTRLLAVSASMLLLLTVLKLFHYHCICYGGLGSGASDVTAAIVLGQHDGARGRQRRT